MRRWVTLALVTVIVTGFFGFTMHQIDPLWRPGPPSLVGQTNATSGKQIKYRGVATVMPAGWRGEEGPGLLIEQGERVVDVSWFDVVDGVVSDSGKGRQHAAVVDARSQNTFTGAPVHRDVGGHPAVELAVSQNEDVWQKLRTYVFTPHRVVLVECHSWQNWDAVVPGCATVVDGLTVRDV